MKKNYLFLILIIFLMTGCDVKYNININDDFTVLEKSVLTGTSDFFKPYYKTTKKNVLEEILGNYEARLKDKNYGYQLVDGDSTYVSLEKKYDNIQNYLDNSILFNDYFEKISYNTNGNLVRIETEGFNPNEEDNPDRFYVRKLEVSITCAYKVVESNATKIDKKTNTYYFEMSENSDDFKILLEFDKSSRFIKDMDKYLIIGGSIVVIIASWIFVFKVNKKKRYN